MPSHTALIVGLGSIGRRHARNWASLGFGPVLTCRSVGAPLPEPLGVDVEEFRDLDRALARQPDLVIVANPTSLHLEVARKAIDAGCNVLVEKPIAASLDGLARLLEEADARSRKVFVGYHLRFDPLVQQLKEAVTNQELGRSLSVRADYGEYLPGWHPWEDYRGSYSARRELGGGPILTLSHEIDLACWIFGIPRRVTAVARHVSDLEIDTEDVAEIILDIPNGALATVHVDEVRRPPRRLIEVSAEKGVIRWDADQGVLQIANIETGKNRVVQADERFHRNDLFLDELRAIRNALLGEHGGAVADGRQGAAILTVALAALESSQTGKTVDLYDDPAYKRAAIWLSAFPT